MGTADCILNKVEDRHAVPYWRVEMRAIGIEEEIAPAVDCSKKIGEFEIGLHL